MRRLFCSIMWRQRLQVKGEQMKKLLSIVAILLFMFAGFGALGGCSGTIKDAKSTVVESPALIGEITVRDGYMLRRDIIPQLCRVFGLTQEKVKQALAETGQDAGFSSINDYRSFEGVMLPGKYRIFEGNKLELFLYDCLHDFEKATNTITTQTNGRNDLTLSEQVVLASIIQAECLGGEYLDETSTVFQNRMIADAKLQSCVTAEYALEYQRSFLTTKDVMIESAYNTYYVVGLPPGPICSFSIESLTAAMKTKMDSEIYYFYYDYLAEEMHFYADYSLFKKAASKSLGDFIQKSDVGPRDKINKQLQYSK